MATTKTKEIKPAEVEEVRERIPSADELKLEQLTSQGFILVQWVGAKTIMKPAPSPNQAIRRFGAENYGLVAPKAYMMIHRDDFDARFFRRPTAKEKPAKDKVKLSISGRFGQVIRVTWDK